MRIALAQINNTVGDLDGNSAKILDFARHAERAGAEVRRGVTVMSIAPGADPSLVAASNGAEERIHARLIVAADGRGSAARKWSGFTTQDENAVRSWRA